MLISFLILIVTIRGITIHNFELPDIENRSNKTLLVEYLYITNKAFILSTFFGPINAFISSSFWWGFGWLDVKPNIFLIKILAKLPALFIAYCLAASYKNKSTEYLSQLINILGFLVSLAILTTVYYTKRFNVHGRYLLQPYLMFLIYGTVFLPTTINKHENWIKTIALSLVIAVQVTAILSIINRYYS